jgi:hypothetical protein
MSSPIKELRSWSLRPRPFSKGRIYCLSGRCANILRFNKVTGDSQGLRGANLKILGHCEVRWNFVQIRPLEKGRSLIPLAPMRLEQSRGLSGPPARRARILYYFTSFMRLSARPGLSASKTMASNSTLKAVADHFAFSIWTGLVELASGR